MEAPNHLHSEELALRECSIELLPAGTVVVAVIGQGKTRGMSARLEISACINQNLAYVSPGPLLDSRFLHQFLHHNYAALRGQGRGSNQDALNHIEVV
jgi:type I restriction enzyme S subunit